MQHTPLRMLKNAGRAVPLTPLGAVVAAGGYASYAHWGRGSSDFVVVAATMGVAAIFLVAFLSVSIATLILRRQLRQDPHQPWTGSFQVDQAVSNDFRFSRFAFWPMVQSSVSWVEPNSVTVRLVPDGPFWKEIARPKKRGRWQHIQRRFVVSDLFGLTRWVFDVRSPARVRVAPRAMPVDLKIAFLDGAEDGYAHPQGAPIGDFIELRRYSPGDPLKNVLWKAYARTGKLFVRTPENAMDVLPSTAAYFIAGDGDEHCASVARSLLQNRLLGEDLLFAADGRDDLARTPEAALELVVDSAHHSGPGGEGLHAFETQMRRERIDRCLLIVPNREGQWVGAVAKFMAQSKTPPVLISAVDAVSISNPSSLPRWLFAPAEEGPMASDTVKAVARRMSQLGSELRVVNGQTGQVLTPSQLHSSEYS